MATQVIKPGKREEFAQPYGSVPEIIKDGPFVNNVTLEEAMVGGAPYSPLPAGLFSAEYIEDSRTRLARYRQAWDFYLGNQYDDPFDEGELKTIVNFTQLVADIGVDWRLAKGWSVTCSSGNALIAEMLNTIWESNYRMTTCQSLGLMGAVTGDTFLMVFVETKENGKELPKAQWRIRLLPLNPAFCFPLFNPTSPGDLLSILIQCPILEPETSERKLFSMQMTPTSWTIWHDDVKIATKPNPLGTVPVVHIRNFINPISCFGISDIQSIVPLNSAYNDVQNVIRRVLAYHAEPTTVVYGAKVGDMERGAKRVWSGLPADARVENLALNAELVEARNSANDYRDLIAQLSRIPKNLFTGDFSAISNTSGLALQLMFGPLLDKTERRRRNYSDGFAKVNRLILMVAERILGIDVSILADFPESRYAMVTKFTSPLPFDEKGALDAAQMKLNMRIWSRAEAQRRLSDVSDFTRLVTEVCADERAALAIALETQRANLGQEPNLSAVFLNSSLLSEDLEAMAQETPEPQETPKAAVIKT